MRGGDPYSKAGCKRGLSFSPHARGGDPSREKIFISV